MKKIQEMLQNAKTEVHWMVPRLQFRRAVFYDRDKMLLQCAKRNVKVRIITEIGKENVEEVNKLSRFCDIRHASSVTSSITIVDDKELIIGSAVHTMEDLTISELVHKLWTNDSSHINIMKDFFEKVWSGSTPAELEIKSKNSERKS